MSDDKRGYNLKTIRQLLREAFTPEQLRRACLDSEALRPVADDFGPKHSLNDMVDAVIDYCRTQNLFDDLLKVVKRENPAQYARFKKKLRVSVANTDEAFSASAEDVSEGSATWRLYRSAGDQALSSKNWKLAVEEYTLVLEDKPEDAEVYARRGEAYLNMSEYDEAIRDLNRSIALSPSHGAYHDRARAYYAQQRYDQALSDNNEALKRYPKASSTLWNRGLVKEAQGDKFDAIWDFVECATVDSSYGKRVKEKLPNLLTPPLGVPPYLSILDTATLRGLCSKPVTDVPVPIRLGHLARDFVTFAPIEPSPPSQRTTWSPGEVSTLDIQRFPLRPPLESDWRATDVFEQSEARFPAEDIPDLEKVLSRYLELTKLKDLEARLSAETSLDFGPALLRYLKLKKQLESALISIDDYVRPLQQFRGSLRADSRSLDFWTISPTASQAQRTEMLNKLRHAASSMVDMGLLYWGQEQTDHGHELLAMSWLIYYQLGDKDAGAIASFLSTRGYSGLGGLGLRSLLSPQS